MKHKRVIKKYANRRLYDTEESRYVTLKDIKNIIALGVDVSIIDDTKDVDITRPLLLQIVSEQELGGTPLLNEAVLNQ
jgi:polyhydroxyalkanoate synthesis repressor PhaR